MDCDDQHRTGNVLEHAHEGSFIFRRERFGLWGNVLKYRAGCTLSRAQR